MGLVIDITERQIELLRASIAEMGTCGEQISDQFYAHLFRLDPGLRYLFGEDLSEQHHSLTFMMDFIVRRLHHWEELQPRLKNLAIRHATYGVRTADYATFSRAMIETISARQTDPETVAAWKALFEAISATMIDAVE
jgi:hemoglobin-like flavoprotein